MTKDDALTPTDGTASEPNGHHPPGAPETMLELRQEVAELAGSLHGALRRLRVRGGDREIEVEWASPAGTPEPVAPRPASAPLSGEPQPAALASPVVADDSLTAVRAPLVGCYYAAPSPGAEPFVQIGDAVEAGTTVAIIEAMKLMNTIVAGESGVVTEVLVSNGESVEFDQILLQLRPREEAA